MSHDPAVPDVCLTEAAIFLHETDKLKAVMDPLPAPCIHTPSHTLLTSERLLVFFSPSAQCLWVQTSHTHTHTHSAVHLHSHDSCCFRGSRGRREPAATRPPEIDLELLGGSNPPQAAVWLLSGLMTLDITVLSD